MEEQKERTLLDAIEEEESENKIGCEDCDYTGKIEITEWISGEHGGYLESTGEFRKCHCQTDWDDQDD